MENNIPIVVLGGAGFIGSHLVQTLSKSTESSILVLDNLHRARAGVLDNWKEIPNVTYVMGDIRNISDLSKVMHGAGLVFHLAAQSNVIGAQADIDYSFTTNVVGTYNVLKTACAEGVNRIVFTSSREVYGDPEDIPVTESARLAPKNAYGSSKYTGELYSQVFHQLYGLDVRIVRLANVYGPGDTDRVIPIFCHNAQEGKPLTVYGGQQIIDFVWIDDVVHALLDVAGLEHWDGPVNIGGGQGVSVIELAGMIKGIYGPDIKVEIQPARDIEVTRFIADLRKMRSTLGWIPELPSLRHLRDVAVSTGKTN